MSTPELKRILIPDVSYAQSSTVWQKMFRHGIVRLGYGTNEDKMLQNNLIAANQLRTGLGFYHALYCKSDTDAKEQAEFCLKLLKSMKGDIVRSLPIYVDYEYFSDDYFKKMNGREASKSERTSIIKTFCETLEKQGEFVGVYFNPDYINNKINYDELKKYTLWLAHWGKDSENPVHQTGVIKINNTDTDINYVDPNFINVVTNFYTKKGC